MNCFSRRSLLFALSGFLLGPLITRIYDAGQAGHNAADSIFLRHSVDARKRLTVDFEPLKTGTAAPMSATLNVVLALD
ncbi:MAG: hypothetical protein WD078_14105 [Woeseia sp.]